MTEFSIVNNLPAAEYHARPALSAGGAQALLEDCPAAFYHSSPLNPDGWPREDKREFDIGTAVHLALLEPDEYERRTLYVDADSWRTNAAKDARAAAYASNRTPLLPKDSLLIEDMRDAIRNHEIAAELTFNGAVEQSMFWDDPDYGVPCKLRADVRRPQYLVDVKTAASSHPRALSQAAWRDGWPLRAAWYAHGVECVTGERIQRYWFVVVGKEPPHLVTVGYLGERTLAWGDLQRRKALDLFARCMETNTWPGYAEKPVEIDIPQWAEFQLADREQAGEFTVEPRKRTNRLEVKTPTRGDFKRAIDMFKPL